MNLLVLLPTILAPLLLAVAGVAMIVGARRFAKQLFLIVCVIVVAPVILGPFLAALPGWVFWLLLPALGLAVAAAAVSFLFGKRVWDEAVGHWLAPLVGPLWFAGTTVLLLMVFL